MAELQHNTGPLQVQFSSVQDGINTGPLQVQFSSVQDGIYALGKPHNYALHHRLRKSANVAFETVPLNVRLIDDGPLSSFQTSRPRVGVRRKKLYY